MNSSNLSRGISMKYTRYLINGNYSLFDQYQPQNSFVSSIVAILDIIRSFYLLSFCMFLMPFAIILDIGRLFRLLELKISRKFKQYSLVYKFRKNTINLIFKGSRMAYLLIQKTDSFIHLKL